MTANRDGPALLARFADRHDAESAMTAVEAHGPPARRVDLIPPPTRTARFYRRRLLWGGRGALAGALIGGLMGGVYAAVMDLERGMIVGTSAGAILTGVVIGAVLLGTLGLIAGFGVGESKAPKEVSDRELAEDAIPGEALVRVLLADDADDRPVRDILKQAGALSIGPESHSEWTDERVLRSRDVRERAA